MIPARRGLLGLLALIVLGVAAFASSAQAAVPEFVVGGVLVKAGLDATLEGKQIGRGTLLVKAINTEINCEKFSVNKGLLNSSTDAELEQTYEECTVLELAIPLGEIPCSVGAEISPGVLDKKIKVSALILPAELNDGSFAVLAEKIQALIKLSGPECPLAKDNTVTGDLCMKIGKDAGGVTTNEKVKVILETSEAIQGECRPRETLEGKEGAGSIKDVIKYGALPVILDGKSEVFLGGTLEHNGKTLGVLLF